MKNRKVYFEENLKRLLQASCGTEVAVTSAMRERLHARLIHMLHRRSQPAEFPESVLGFLTGLIFLPCLAWAACAWWGTVDLAGCVLNGPILALVIINLIGIPIASLTIILRRKYA